MTTYAVMMACRSGTISMHGDSWVDNMHLVTWTGHESLEEAEREAEKHRPIGFNRERAILWVAPWNRRYDPYTMPRTVPALVGAF